jgi:hypothetical protein
MNLQELFQVAKNCQNYATFERIVASVMFNLPMSADNSEQMDKLFLTDGGDAAILKELVEKLTQATDMMWIDKDVYQETVALFKEIEQLKQQLK